MIVRECKIPNVVSNLTNKGLNLTRRTVKRVLNKKEVRCLLQKDIFTRAYLERHRHFGTEIHGMMWLKIEFLSEFLAWGYYLDYVHANYCPHFYCYYHNVSTLMSFSYHQIIVDPGNFRKFEIKLFN